MAIKINNRRFRSPKGKKESNLIPISKWVLNCRADGTAPKEENLCRSKILELLQQKNDYLDVKDISKNIGFSEQHTRRILRHLSLIHI